MLKTVSIISVVLLLAALSVQGSDAQTKCEQLNKHNPILLAQCPILSN